MRERYEFQAVLRQAESPGGAYVVFPWDLREEFGAGRVKVHVLFDGIPCDGSIVNMGLKGRICYLIGVRKSVRAALGKTFGDTVHVAVTRRQRGLTREKRPWTVRRAGTSEKWIDETEGGET